MYEQLTIKGFFAELPENAEDLPPAMPAPILASEDRPLDKVKKPTPRKRSREREER